MEMAVGGATMKGKLAKRPVRIQPNADTKACVVTRSELWDQL